MAPQIHTAKLTVSCPLFAADFDPRNSGQLLVGGGGGEGRSGVGNKIYLLDTSRRHELTEAFELELSRDEDSVTSLAAAPSLTDEKGSLSVLAGINSSLEQRKKDNNTHLRTFRVTPPRRNRVVAPRADRAAERAEQDTEGQEEQKTTEELIPGSAELLSQAKVFYSNYKDSADVYQRVLRLSRWRARSDAAMEGESPAYYRVGAIATGLSPLGELMFLRVSPPTDSKDVIGRLTLEKNAEVEDVDFVSLGQSADLFGFVYTDGLRVMNGDISTKAVSVAAPAAREVYSTVLSKKGSGSRPKVRALRFLSPTTLLVLENAPNRSGSQLVLLQLPGAKGDSAKVLQRCKLPSSMKIGLGLDVCALGTNPEGQQQTIIAASGNDHSIALWTVEYEPQRGFGSIRPHTTLRNVHPFSMTKLCFSTFTAPSHPIGPEVGRQHVKLASVSMGNTVVVHTIPLSPYPPPSRTPRYVLSQPGPSELRDTLLFVLALICSLSAILLAIQAYAEIRGASPPYLGATDLLPQGMRDYWAMPYQPSPDRQPSFLDKWIQPKGGIPVLQTQQPLESLRDILSRVHAAGAAPADLDVHTPQSLSLIVRCNPRAGLTAAQSVLVETVQSAHHEEDIDKIRDQLRSWRDLSEQEQSVWKQRLMDAGRWASSEGETVLQGVLFGEACGALHQLVRDELP